MIGAKDADLIKEDNGLAILRVSGFGRCLLMCFWNWIKK